MAASIQDHFHILDAEPDAVTTTGEWYAAAEGGSPEFWPVPMVFAAPTWSLDGSTFYSHVLESEGSPVMKKNYNFTVYLESWVDYETWQGYLGTTKYLVPVYHDPAAHDDYDVLVYIEALGQPETKSYRYQYIRLPVKALAAA